MQTASSIYGSGVGVRKAFAIVAALIMVAVVFQVAVSPGAAVSDVPSVLELDDVSESQMAGDSGSNTDSGSVNLAEEVTPIVGGLPGGSVESIGGPLAPTISSAGVPVQVPEFITTEHSLTVRTSSGVYQMSQSYLESIALLTADDEILVRGSYFSLKSPSFSSVVPVNQVLGRVGESVLVARYGLVTDDSSPSSVCTMEVTTDFSSYVEPKMTARVVEVSPWVVDWQVVWLIEPAPGARISIPKMTGKSLSIEQLANVRVPVDLSVDVSVMGSTGIRQFSADWKDAEEGSLTVKPTASGAYVMEVAFGLERAEIDPTMVATSTGGNPTGYTSQRKVVWDDGYYWAFYYRGDAICYKSSADGLSWSSEYVLPGGTPIATNLGFDVSARDGKIGVGWIDSTNAFAYFKAGEFLGSKILWSSTSTVYTFSPTFDTLSPVSVAIGADGAYVVFVQTNEHVVYLTHQFGVFRSFEGANWESIGPAYPDNVVLSSSVTTWNVVLPLGDGDLVLLETSDLASTIRVRYWFSEFGAVDGWTGATTYSISLDSGTKGDKFSAIVTPDGYTHIAMKSSADKLKYVRISLSGVMSSIDLTTLTINGYPTISLDENNDLHVFWLDTSYVIRHIQATGGYIDAWSPIDTFYTSTSAVTGLTSWMNPVGTHALLWTKMLSPTEVTFGSIPLPYGTPGASSGPWNTDGLSPTGSYFSSFKDAVSPGSGLLTLFETDASVECRGLELSISRIYQQPRFFTSTDGSPYLSFAFPFSDLGPGWSLDLPWMDENYVYVGSGQRYIIEWGNSGDSNEFENHEGVHFVLRDVSKAGPVPLQYYELIFSSGVRYMFVYSTYWLSQITDLRGYDPDNLYYSPPYNSVSVGYDDYDRLSYLQDMATDRRISFSYDVNGMLQTITRPDDDTIQLGYTYLGNAYRLTSVVDPIGRITTYSYLSSKNYVLESVAFPTGAKNTYAYAEDLSVGTEARSWLVTQQKVTDSASGALFRQTDYDYKVVSGKVRFVKVTEKNGVGVVQGSTEQVFVSSMEYSSKTVKDANGVQMSKSVTWYDECGQPSRVDTYKGSSQIVSYSEYMEYDNWGNLIFTRNAMGYESYASFANTDTQNSFQGGALLTRTTSGKVFYDSFDDWEISDWSITHASSGTVSTDGSADPPNAPAMKLLCSSSGAYVEVEHVFAAQSGDFIVQFAMRTNGVLSTDYPQFFLMAGYVQRLDIRAIEGNFEYFTVSGWASLGVPCSPDTWYDIGLVIRGTVFDFYVDGVAKKTGANLFNSGSIDTLRVSLYGGAAGVNLFVDNIRMYTSLTVSVSMPSGHVAELYDSNGEVLDRSKTGALVIPALPLDFPPGYIVISKIGFSSFRTPLMDIWGGDSYSMSAGTSLSSLPKETTGFARYSDHIADDGWPVGANVIDSGGDCTWTTDSDYSARGTMYHQSAYAELSHYHGYYYTGDYLVTYPQYVLQQYVWLTEGELPREIAIQYFWGSTWKRAYWGGGFNDEDIISSPDYTPSHTVRIGDVPQVTGKWLQLAIKASDLGITSTTYVYGVVYGLYGGTARWDFTSRSSDGIQVYGLSSTQTVELYLDEGLSFSGTSATPPVMLDVCSMKRVFPSSGYFKIFEGTQLVYQSPWIEEIWNYDLYRYSPGKWYPNDVKTDGVVKGWIHDRQVGVLQYQDAGKTVPQEIYCSYSSEGDAVERKFWLDSGWVYSFDEYDIYGNQILSTDPTGRGTSTVYSVDDLYTYPVEVKKVGPGAESERMQYTYDMNTGSVLSATNALGRTVSYLYDDLGRIVRVTNPDGTYRTLTYDDVNRKITGLDELNHKTVMSYDQLGRDTKIERYGSGTSVYSSQIKAYDWQDNLVTRTDERGHVTTMTYDFLGRTTRITNPDASYMTVSYDDIALVVTGQWYTSGGTLTHKTAMVYDDLGRQTATREYSSSTSYYQTSMTYDAVGNLKTVDDARSAYAQVTTLSYDSLNRLIRTSYPDGYSEYATYDDSGRVLTKTDREGNVTTTSYDAIGRLSQMTSPSDTVTYGYDLAGQKTSAVNSLGTITYGYNNRGWVTSMSQTIGASSYAVAFGYNAVGVQTSITYPDGVQVAFTPDAYDRITTVAVSGTIRLSIIYNTDDSVSTETTRDDAGVAEEVTSYSYNNRDWITNVQTSKGTTVLYSLGYTYDDVGNVKTRGSETFGYDWLSRLLSASGGSLPTGLTYTYDQVGNLASKGGVARTYGIYNKITSDGIYSYSHDPNGNIAWKTSATQKWNYQFNSLDQLTKIVKSAYNSKTGKWTTTTQGEYYYDANGARAKAVEGTTITEYVYVGHDPLCEKTGTTYVDYVYVNGKVKIRLSGSNTYFYFHDALGSTMQVWALGAKKATYKVVTYEPFGKPVSVTGTERLTFTGEILVPGAGPAGVYYIGARWYDPDLGRWLSLDTSLGSAVAPQTLNRYVYCGNNPLIFVDPTGDVWQFLVVGALCGGIAGGASYFADWWSKGDEPFSSGLLTKRILLGALYGVVQTGTWFASPVLSGYGLGTPPGIPGAVVGWVEPYMDRILNLDKPDYMRLPHERPKYDGPTANEVKEWFGDLADSVVDGGEQLADSIGDVAEDVSDAAVDFAVDFYETAVDFVDDVGEATVDTTIWLVEQLDNIAVSAYEAIVSVDWSFWD